MLFAGNKYLLLKRITVQNINSNHSTTPSPFPTSNPCYKNAAILIISIWVGQRHLLRVR